MGLPRFRYRLRTLFGITLVLAFSAATYGNHLRTLQRQKEAFQKIAEKGGWVLHYDEGAYIGFGPPAWGGLCGTGLRDICQPTNVPITFCDRDMSLLNDIVKIRTIDFGGTRVSKVFQEQFQHLHRDCSVKP